MQRLSNLNNRLVGWMRSAYHSLFFPAVIVLIVIIIVTFWAARTASTALERNLQNGMEAQAATLHRAVRIRLQGHEQTLRGGAALFQSNPTIDEAQWSEYVQSYNHIKDYPSLEELGIARVGEDADAVNVAYVWPEGSTPSMGDDLGTSPDFEELLKRTSAERRTSVVHSVTDSSRMLIALPFFRVGEEATPGSSTNASPVGYVYGQINAKKFFDKVMDDTLLSGVRIQVFTDRTGATPLYISPDFQRFGVDSTLSKTYYFNGQPFSITLRYSQLSLVSKTQLDGPLLIMSGGVLAGLLISSIVYLLLASRSRELQIEKANDVNLAKDDLLSLASHQLRTPATGVKQYLGMVLQGFAGSVTERQKTLLEKAYASNDRQLAVINEVLHLAKIDAGRIILARQDTNIGDLVQDVISEQNPDIQRAGHTISLRQPIRPVVLSVDAHMLRMAIENLVSNAIKYTPDKGNIFVTVTHTKLHARIAVQDSGIGIKDEDFDRLFHQFTRLPNEMSYKVSGTGVGLYLAKHLVELHGGSITVSSVPGKGSTFIVTLPYRSNTAKTEKKL